MVGCGPTARWFREPVHPYPRGLIEAVPSPERAEALTGIDGQQPRPGRRGAGCSFAPRCGHAIGDCTTEDPEPVVIAGRSVRCLRVWDIQATRPERAAARACPPATTAAPTLSVRGICASHGSTPVLFDVWLEVPSPACVAVVGESGSGKTTLARCVAGLHSNWTREITFHGAPPARGARQRGKERLQGGP